MHAKPLIYIYGRHLWRPIPRLEEMNEGPGPGLLQELYDVPLIITHHPHSKTYQLTP